MMANSTTGFDCKCSDLLIHPLTCDSHSGSTSTSFATNDMTFLINEVTIRHHVHKQKMSYYDKNAPSQQQESESAGYVKVKLIAAPLSSTKILFFSFQENSKQ